MLHWKLIPQPNNAAAVNIINLLWKRQENYSALEVVLK